MRSALWLVGLAIGCRAEVPAEAESPAEELEPSPWTYEGAEPGAASFDADSLSRVLLSFMERAPEYHAAGIIDHYYESLSLADTTCPTWFEYEGQSYWFADCETQAGAQFDGYLFAYVYEQEDIYDNGDIWDMDQLYGFATVIAPQDRWLHVGGAATYGEMRREDGVVAAYSLLQGGFLSEDSATSAVFGDGDSLNLALYSGTYEAYPQYRFLSVTGQLSGFGLDGEAVDIESLVASNMYDCPEELMGSVEIRDAGGTWWTVDFDGNPEEWSIDSALCDGCGAVSLDGERVGELCVDAEVMLDWTGRPW